MPTNQIINDVLPWTQASASNLQTVFDTNWTAAYASDVVVYQRGANEVPDELTQMLLESEYVVTFVGTAQVVRVTLLTPAPAGDIITITRNTPVDRLNLYTNTNFVPSMLNQDTALLTLVDQERAMLNQQSVRYHLSELNPNFAGTENPPVVPLGPNQIWAMNPNGNAFIAYDVPEGGGVATDKATYILQEPHIGLPNAQAMSELPTGLVVSNSGTGVQVTRVIEGIIHQTVVFNANGLADNPSIGIADNAILPGTAGMGVPAGTTAQRVTPTGTNISLRFNTDLGQLEAYIGGQWVLVPSSAAGLFLPLAGGTMTGDINMGGHSITNLDDPSNAGDAVNKAYADAIAALLANYLPLGGGTMAGNILMDGHIIDGLPLPLTNNEAASKIYVDNAIGGAAGGITGNIQWNNGGVFAGDPNFNTDGNGNVGLTGSFEIDNLLLDGNRISPTSGKVELESAQLFNAFDANSKLINNLATPIAGTDAATKDYVDQTALNGTSVYAATTTNLTVTQSGAGAGATLTNAGAQAVFAIDGVSPPVGSLVLVKNLAAPANEGIYSVTNVGSVSTNWVLTRATSYDTPTEINNTGLIIVRNGSSLAGTAWYNTATIITVDTTAFNYVSFGVALPITVSNGGTGRTTLDTYRLLAGGTTNTGNVQSVNPGSNGQLLQSKGNAALPDFTTATYPTTTTSGRLLYSSANNVVGELTTGTGVNAALGQNVSGSGSMALTTSPTFVTPILGVASATSISFGSAALDNYEVGTFTPTITCTTPGNLAVTYGTRQGVYQRIGNQVYYNLIVVGTNVTFTTASGTIAAGGLPFAGTATSAIMYASTVLGGGSFTPLANTTGYCAAVSNGSTSSFVAAAKATSGTLMGLPITNFTTGNGIVMQQFGMYKI